MVPNSMVSEFLNIVIYVLNVCNRWFYIDLFMFLETLISKWWTQFNIGVRLFVNF